MSYEVWTYTRGVVAQSFAHDDRDIAHREFRRAKGAAVFARGDVVLSGNADVTPKLMPIIRRLVAAAKGAAPPQEAEAFKLERCTRPGCPLPAKRDSESTLCPIHERQLVALERQRARDDAQRVAPAPIRGRCDDCGELAPDHAVGCEHAAPLEPEDFDGDERAPVEVPPTLEAAPPIAVSKPEPMPEKEPMPKPANCSKCSKHPVDAITKHTPSGTEGWCRHCRRMESAARSVKRDAAPAAVPAVGSVGSVGSALAMVARQAAVIRALGGITVAESIAQIAQEIGGGSAIIETFSALKRIEDESHA